MEVSGQLHAPTALPTDKELPMPNEQEARRAQSRSGRGGEEKNARPCRESNTGRLARSLVFILTEVPQLLSL
jgi:hypothetical protein